MDWIKTHTKLKFHLNNIVKIALILLKLWSKLINNLFNKDVSVINILDWIPILLNILIFNSKYNSKIRLIIVY